MANREKTLYTVTRDAMVTVEVRADSQEEAETIGLKSIGALVERLDREAFHDPEANGDWRLPLLLLLDEVETAEITDPPGEES